MKRLFDVTLQYLFHEAAGEWRRQAASQCQQGWQKTDSAGSGHFRRYLVETHLIRISNVFWSSARRSRVVPSNSIRSHGSRSEIRNNETESQIPQQLRFPNSCFRILRTQQSWRKKNSQCTNTFFIRNKTNLFVKEPPFKINEEVLKKRKKQTNTETKAKVGI